MYIPELMKLPIFILRELFALASEKNIKKDFFYSNSLSDNRNFERPW